VAQIRQFAAGLLARDRPLTMMTSLNFEPPNDIFLVENEISFSVHSGRPAASANAVSS
jgi:hypothetical protein